MQSWIAPWSTIAADDSLLIALGQQHIEFQTAGEPFYLIQKRWDRDVRIAMLSRWGRDPSSPGFVAEAWTEPDGPDEFPDVQRARAWLMTSAGDVELDKAASPEHFTPGRPEFALVHRMRQVGPDGARLADAVFLVVNAPPHDGILPVKLEFRPISPGVDVGRRQPVRDNVPGYEMSLRGWRQWLNPRATFRDVPTPHTLPIAVPVDRREVTISRDGVMRVAPAEWVTSPPPFAPALLDGDILVRKGNGQRYQVGPVQYDWGIGFSGGMPALKAQQITVKMLETNDPRHNIPIDGTIGIRR